MATTLPSLTETLDTIFTNTWYEIRAEAIDNILNANVIWAALRQAGSFRPQVGGRFITRTVLYGETPVEAVIKGDLLPEGETELETLARWT